MIRKSQPAAKTAAKSLPLAAQKNSAGLLAIGSSGSWEIAIDRTLSGLDRWFAQIEGPSVYLRFEIPALLVIEQAERFFAHGKVGKHINGKKASSAAARSGLALGTSKTTSVSLLQDDEFNDRFFLVVEQNGGLLARFAIHGSDVDHLVEALRQLKEDVADAT